MSEDRLEYLPGEGRSIATMPFVVDNEGDLSRPMQDYEDLRVLVIQALNEFHDRLRKLEYADNLNFLP